MRIKLFGSCGSHQVTPCCELHFAAEELVGIGDFDFDDALVGNST
ncbi:hypothetical protein [Arthrobacter sp. Y81]|nr:hypothetical protein [Arthrobacter sp. Y81]